MEDLYPVITVQKYFEVIFVKNQAEYRNGENDITGLQKNIICLTNILKTQWILNTSLEHVLAIKPLIYELLLCFH